MVKNPPDGMPRITPYLCYKDVSAALEWLEHAFGFARREVIAAPDGAIMHAEMTYREAVIMMGPPCPEEETQSPLGLNGASQINYLYVDDVDAHHRQAVAAGAQGVSAPQEMFWGDRIYSAQDHEGHRWTFAQHVKDIAPEDMQPPFA
jgi:uncharacterized glyoxalase superfamily protein PhnB